MLLNARDLVLALGGNVSAGLPMAKEFRITTLNIQLGELTPENFIKLDLERYIIEGVGRPSIR